MALHPSQRELPAEISDIWLAALEDAEIPADQALLYIFDGEQSEMGYAAHYFPAGLRIEPDPNLPDVDDVLGEMNSEPSVDAHRILVWTERTPEGIAALLRHELEHARQRQAHGDRFFELARVAEAVIAERVGGLPGGGVLYQAIPTELDANAAAARFAQSRYGEDRILQLLKAGDKDASAFRSRVGPPDIDTLPERVIYFLAGVPDLCELWAARQGFGVATLLDSHWRGAGEVWTRLTQDKELRLPRR